MPPILALILCTVFVLFLLRIDRKQAPDVSRAFWIPTIWMLYIASKPLASWFGSPGDSVESGSPLDQVFLSALLVLGVFILVVRNFSWSSAIRENPWVILLICFMLFSILWSDVPFISFKRWIREFLAVIMAFVVTTEWSPRQAMESLFRRLSYTLIPFSVLLIKYFPKYGVIYTRWEGAQMWIGVTTHKNGLGLLCLIVTFYLIWTLVRRWQSRDTPVSRYHTYAELILLITTLWLLKSQEGMYSATSVVTLAAGLVGLVGLFWSKKHNIYVGINKWMTLVILIIIFGIVTPMVGGLTVAGFSSIVGRNETLTGRTDIWAGLLHYAEQRPILGYGFGGFWTTRTIEKFTVSEAHNGYLEVLTELGYVGLFITATFLLSCTRRAHWALAYDFDWGSLCVCFLLMAVLHNITEASLNTFTNPLTAIVLFMAISSEAAASYVPGFALEVSYLDT